MRSWEEPGEFAPTPEEEAGMIADDRNLCPICRRTVSYRDEHKRYVVFPISMSVFDTGRFGDDFCFVMRYHEACISDCEALARAETLVECIEVRIFRADGEDELGQVTPTYYCRDRNAALALVSDLFDAGYCDLWINPMQITSGVVGLLQSVQHLHGDDVRERKVKKETA